MRQINKLRTQAYGDSIFVIKVDNYPRRKAFASTAFKNGRESIIPPPTAVVPSPLKTRSRDLANPTDGGENGSKRSVRIEDPETKSLYTPLGIKIQDESDPDSMSIFKDLECEP